MRHAWFHARWGGGGSHRQHIKLFYFRRHNFSTYVTQLEKSSVGIPWNNLYKIDYLFTLSYFFLVGPFVPLKKIINSSKTAYNFFSLKCTTWQGSNFKKFSDACFSMKLKHNPAKCIIMKFGVKSMTSWEAYTRYDTNLRYQKKWRQD